tara:strand:+ start:403 stop:834 length:432 start_codon:yes stop_codon:yes gene_type:complete
MPLPQQERVAAALERAKTQETVGGLDPVTQRMWDSFTDEERWRVLQLPKADRATEIQRYHAKKRETYRTNPFLRQIESERQGQPRSEQEATPQRLHSAVPRDEGSLREGPSSYPASDELSEMLGGREPQRESKPQRRWEGGTE